MLGRIATEETRRNLAANTSEGLSFMEFVLESVPYEIVWLPNEQVLSTGKYTALKDAPIAAATRKAKVEMLVTFDRKHFPGRPDLTLHVGANTVTPKEAERRLREGKGDGLAVRNINVCWWASLYPSSHPYRSDVAIRIASSKLRPIPPTM